MKKRGFLTLQNHIHNFRCLFETLRLGALSPHSLFIVSVYTKLYLQRSSPDITGFYSYVGPKSRASIRSLKFSGIIPSFIDKK